MRSFRGGLGVRLSILVRRLRPDLADLGDDALQLRLRFLKMLELGELSESLHRDCGRAAAGSKLSRLYTIGGEPSLVASYLCTPLVTLPVSSLKPGAHVRGKTIAEFGSRNRPLDMVVYKKGGQDFLLIANNARGVMKVPTATFASAKAINEPNSSSRRPLN